MDYISKIIMFLFVNTMGYYTPTACYLTGVALGRIVPSDPNFNPAQLKAFFAGIVMTWLVCAVFSFGSFFFKGPERMVFLIAPVVVPMAYGLSVVFLF